MVNNHIIFFKLFPNSRYPRSVQVCPRPPPSPTGSSSSSSPSQRATPSYAHLSLFLYNSLFFTFHIMWLQTCLSFYNIISCHEYMARDGRRVMSQLLYGLIGVWVVAPYRVCERFWVCNIFCEYLKILLWAIFWKLQLDQFYKVEHTFSAYRSILCVACMRCLQGGEPTAAPSPAPVS